MMKKRIVIVLAVGFSLVGCSKTTPKEVAQQQPLVEKDEPTTENQPEAVEPEGVAASMTRNEFISATFAEYGYMVPSESSWIVKEEGNHKVAVVIKEFVNQGKPLISKLIFLEEDTNTILFLQVENTIIIDN